MPVIPTMEFLDYHHTSSEVHTRNDDVLATANVGQHGGHSTESA